MKSTVTLKGWAVLPEWGYRTFSLSKEFGNVNEKQLFIEVTLDWLDANSEDYDVESVSVTQTF